MWVNLVGTPGVRTRVVRALPRAIRLLPTPRPLIATRQMNKHLGSLQLGISRSNTTHSPASASPLSSSSSNHAPLQPFKTHPPSAYPGSPRVHSFYDDPTATWTFVTADPVTRKAIVIDPVLDYEPSAGKISQTSVKGLAAFLQREGYTVVRICETHVHADHLSGAYALKKVSRSTSLDRTPERKLTPCHVQLLPEQPPVFIGSRVLDVQERFAPVYDIGRDELEGAFDGFMHDSESFSIGSLTAVVRSLPGHTPDSMGIQVGDTVFAGDSLFL